jgi:hypothetical protein
MEPAAPAIEDLAALMQETMAGKAGIQGLATKQDIQELRTEMNQKFGVWEQRNTEGSCAMKHHPSVFHSTHTR